MEELTAGRIVRSAFRVLGHELQRRLLRLPRLITVGEERSTVVGFREVPFELTYVVEAAEDVFVGLDVAADDERLREIETDLSEEVLHFTGQLIYVVDEIGFRERRYICPLERRELTTP